MVHTTNSTLTYVNIYGFEVVFLDGYAIRAFQQKQVLSEAEGERFAGPPRGEHFHPLRHDEET